MDSATLQIQDNMLVDLAYVLTVENEQAERTKKKPISRKFVQGRKQMAPGLEQELYGMSVGEEKDIVVKASKGFGEAKPDAVKTLPRKSVPSFANAAPGQTLRLLHKSSGELHKAVVLDVQPDVIVLDFNHPLAGKTLHYHVRVEGLRPATPEEIEAGQIKEDAAAVKVEPDTQAAAPDTQAAVPDAQAEAPDTQAEADTQAEPNTQAE